MTTAYLKPDLRRDEGVRLKAYKDSLGNWTTGVGHLIHAGSPLLTATLTPALADAILDHDLAVLFVQLDHQLPWWRTLSDLRQDVVANLGFNLGVGKLKTFPDTLGALQHGGFETAARMLLDSLWARQVGARAQRLSRQLATGEHQP